MAQSTGFGAVTPYFLRVTPWRKNRLTARGFVGEARPPLAVYHKPCVRRFVQCRHLSRTALGAAEAPAYWHASCYVYNSSARTYADGPRHPSTLGSGGVSHALYTVPNSVSIARVRTSHRITEPGARDDTADTGCTPCSEAFRPAAAYLRPYSAAQSFCYSPAHGNHGAPQECLLLRHSSLCWHLQFVRWCSGAAENTYLAEYCMEVRCKYVSPEPSACSSVPRGAAERSVEEQSHVLRNAGDSKISDIPAAILSNAVRNTTVCSGTKSGPYSSDSSKNGNNTGSSITTQICRVDLSRWSDKALLRGGADPVQAALPLVSFDFFTDTCNNAKCRAEAIVGEVRTQAPRSFTLLIDGSAYALMGGLLLLLLTSNLAVVERRVDAHVKGLALLVAAYGSGIALWGCEIAALGRRSTFPAGTPRYLLGLASLWLCVLVLALPESVGPAAAYAALLPSVALQLLLPRLLFTKQQRKKSAAGVKARGGGGWLPQWWGTSRSQQLLPFAALASVAVGMLYVRGIAARASSEIDAAAAAGAAVFEKTRHADLSNVAASSLTCRKEDSSYIGNIDESSSNTQTADCGNCFESSTSSSSDDSTALEGNRGWAAKLTKVFSPERKDGVVVGTATVRENAQTAEEAQREREDLQTLDMTRKWLLAAKQKHQQNAHQQKDPQPLQQIEQQQQAAMKQLPGKQDDTGNGKQ